jgi:probable HAF family extracellular repeat protein
MATYSIVELGAPLPTIGTRAFCLNAKAQAGGRATYSPEGESAVLWTLGIPDVLTAPAPATINGINHAGTAVGTSAPGGTNYQHPFLYKAGALTDLTEKLGDGASPNDINGVGRICGFMMGRDQQIHAFVYDVNASSGPVSLEPPSGFKESVALAINEAGDVVGHYVEGAVAHGFLFAGGQLTDLGDYLELWDLNDTGLIVGEKWTPPNSEDRLAVIYDRNAPNPQIEEIGVLPGGNGSIAFGVNNGGQVVGHSVSGNDVTAFLYSGGVMTDLNDVIAPGSGWVLRSAGDINDDGVIVGEGKLNGEDRGFLLYPPGVVPPPLPTKDLSKYVAVWIMLFGGVTQGGPGWGLTPGGHLIPIPVDPEWWYRLSPGKRDLLAGLALSEMSSLVGDARARKAIQKQATDLIRKSMAAMKKE